MKAAAGFRILIGTGLVLAPGAWSRPWTGPAIEAPVAKLMARMFGNRERLLRVGALAASHDPHQTARWLKLGGIADAVDGAAVLVTWRHLPRTTRYADAAMAFGAAVAHGLLAQRLLDDTTNRHRHGRPPAS